MIRARPVRPSEDSTMTSSCFSVPRTWLAGVTVSLGLSLAAPDAAAQCFGPDNLNAGPCCGLTLPTLPPFPPATLPALGVCWTNCLVGATDTLSLVMSPPSPTGCGQYVAQLTVIDAAGVPAQSGLVRLDYTRTWEETDTAGVATQVWRFTAKADLSATPGGVVPPCNVPSCIAPAGPWPTAFYYGYVDYVSCSGAPPWETVVVLYHACDSFIHRPGFSDKPGAFHPGSSFAIVAPHSPLQPFLPMNQMAPAGALVADATRAIDTSTPLNACFVEDRVVGGLMQKLGVVCLCIPATNPKQQTLRQFAGTTFCVSAAGLPGAWASLNLYPSLPWFHMTTTSLGVWTNANVYPGKESVWVDEGLFVHQEACTGDFVEVKYGATTKDGFLVLTPGLTQTFTDMTDNWSAPLSGPYPLPIFGSAHPSERLIYINTP